MDMRNTIKNKFIKGFLLFLFTFFSVGVQAAEWDENTLFEFFKNHATGTYINDGEGNFVPLQPTDLYFKEDFTDLRNSDGSSYLDSYDFQILKGPYIDGVNAFGVKRVYIGNEVVMGAPESWRGMSAMNFMAQLILIRKYRYFRPSSGGEVEDYYVERLALVSEDIVEITSYQPPPPCNPVCTDGFIVKDCQCVEVPKDPCAEAKKNDARTSNTIILKQNNDIRTLSTIKEYGAEQNLKVFPPATTPIFNIVDVRPGKTNTFTPNFTWNAKDGYTIGVSHGHPGGSGPSPSDILQAFKNLSDPNLIACGQVCIDYYKAHFAITVVTKEETFMINIKDWTALGLMYEKYYGSDYIPAEKKEMVEAFINEAREYLKMQKGDYDGSWCSEQTIYAGVKLYGDVVSIAKFDKTTSKFNPLDVNSSNEIVTKPCLK
jgi:hypothetical protein